MVQQALLAATRLAAEGIEAEVIDPRTIRPLDVDTIADAVRRTNRLVVAHEGWRFAGFGAEIAASITEEAFDYLDAPVARVGALDSVSSGRLLHPGHRGHVYIGSTGGHKASRRAGK